MVTTLGFKIKRDALAAERGGETGKFVNVGHAIWHVKYKDGSTITVCGLMHEIEAFGLEEARRR